MSFNSSDFLIFFPIVVLIYFLIPQKLKNYWLLIASYYFYMCWNAKYALIILFSTIVTYLSAQSSICRYSSSCRHLFLYLSGTGIYD